MDIYQSTIRPILFSGLKTDPEWLHNRTLALLSWLSSNQESTLGHWVKGQLQQRFCLNDGRLEQTLWGVNFPNPMGLAAGFDKDGVAAGIWGSLGFGFAELGTVTFHGQPGNPRPRLFRLVEDKAALNRMGFNNLGAIAMAARLEQLKVNRLQVEQLKVNRLQVGINLGKSKVTPLAEAADDYRSSFGLLRELGDYFVVNVSSPNTPGLRSLQDASQLSLILDALQQENVSQKPILVKIAPDLEWNAIADVLELAQSYGLAGIIATNTTIRRDLLKTQRIAATGKPVTEEAGGISGAPLRQRSTEVIRFIWQETQGTLPIIGVGGIFTAEDAWEKITAGASLIQVYTGWIYNGPWMVRQILQGLLQKLEERGMSSISEAVGSGSG
ncbi:MULTISPECIES: quinone-dependent dihydroorotate dehydrogenase [unclassified Moorena]|uniref:quinone-dependent dihydroorotate dehydrogenase n=1 Tax=unclassified Moorena TaxID=2683338 RepID=UPI0013C1A07F|nr:MULTISPECIES: quinone-dependent dihydroorotate dehydrogenase [unclassified Moorena]NEO07756.1 quinone-dependent dihydroorotate dehydrogenase [Moorena sp. SIO3I8]NEO23925.1 quinone-dependent dihydroorotate dehydrogenase [Moorena sp. SIO4A5]NEP24651.1 quinone-dependent dihydroorotate dehydrogenase [Moorena sp. SIO3I6]NEQ58910.1 quinone-dependent dihydroorotate dehydrogenase [Moorena sp. SIO4A1]